MVNRAKPKDTLGTERVRARKRTRPAKGTGAALLELAGAWSFYSPEEIEQIKKDIFGSRRSRAIGHDDEP
jgi:hypothetical protein